MGVDAVMRVKLKNEVTKEQLRYYSYIFGQAFYPNLFLGYGSEIVNKPLEFHGDELKVALGGRYYGPCYERGPLFNYIIMAEFLEKLIPDCEVYYGGDNSDELELFDKNKRDKFVEHFIQHGGRDNYRRFFDKENDGPNCPVCEVQMVRNGWGANYKFWTCGGCGWQVLEKDGLRKEGFTINE